MAAHDDQIYVAARELLSIYGEPQQRPFGYGLLEYEDEKKKLAISLSFKDGEPDYERMLIAIAMSSEDKHAGNASDGAFKLPKNYEPRGAIVYIWQRRRLFFRPGRWTDYLFGLVQNLHDARAAFMEMNGRHIDDKELFPDTTPR